MLDEYAAKLHTIALPDLDKFTYIRPVVASGDGWGLNPSLKSMQGWRLNNDLGEEAGCAALGKARSGNIYGTLPDHSSTDRYVKFVCIPIQKCRYRLIPLI